MQLEKPEIMSFGKALEKGEIVNRSGYHKVPQNKRFGGRNCGCQKQTEKGAYRDISVELPNGTTLNFYHQTLVVANQANVYQIFNGGYRTSTTKERINRYLPRNFRLYQSDFEWYVSSPNNEEIPFESGMILIDSENPVVISD